MALVAVICHSGAYSVIFATFQFNQDFIAKNLCVNRSKPELKCNGKCYLKKQMAEQEKQTPTGTIITEQQVLAWYFESTAIGQSLLPREAFTVPAAFHRTFATQHSEAPRPHPPCLA